MAHSTARSLGPLPLPRLSAATRGVLSGGIVAFVACLLAAELLLGFTTDGHAIRASLLGVSFFVSIALAGMLHPDELPSRPMHPAEADAHDRAFSSAPGTPVPVQGCVQVEV